MVVVVFVLFGRVLVLVIVDFRLLLEIVFFILCSVVFGLVLLVLFGFLIEISEWVLVRKLLSMLFEWFGVV